ncbi:hypothetical protein EVJ32_04630 [Exiguobacterium sp. SH5S4]|uniref:hypothetical protein n=1 Tax=Exiguobacterium sp. SH5S4 TaxID=2510961 RepID=UPI00103DA025|nr:hypothetical protein [Exiguobacterium sp. SH5S4]TCI26663.1 hypothetical protein EVJ32_04630 [Exiguobacterium sp. SH5S4]
MNAIGQQVNVTIKERMTLEVVSGSKEGLYTFGYVARSFSKEEREFVEVQAAEVVAAIEEEYTTEFNEEYATAIEYVSEDEEYTTYAVKTYDAVWEKEGQYKVEVNKEDSDHMIIKNLKTGHTW